MFTNQIAPVAATTGYQLLRPANKILEFGVRAIEPLTPGKRGQAGSKLLEICLRIAMVAAAILLLLPSLLTTPIGLVLRYVSNLYRKDVYAVHPPSRNPLSKTPLTKLTICTFNVAFMPEFISRHNHLRPTSERAPQAAQKLLRCDDDLICLQEAFDERALLETSASLRKKYPYQAIIAGNQTFGLSSGLALFSKFPLDHIVFQPHREKGGDDRFANKGLLGATVRLPGGQNAFVFTTHLNGGAPHPGGRHFRSQQLKQIQEYIVQYREVLKYISVVGTFVTGDFNIGPDDGTDTAHANPEWPIEPLTSLELTEAYEGAGTCFQMNDPEGITGWDLTQLQNWKIYRERVDHIFTDRKGSRFRREDMGGVSDHLALRATFDLNPQAISRAPNGQASVQKQRTG